MEWIKNFFKNILAAINGSLITKEKTNEEISKDKDEKDKTSQKVRHKLESEIAAYIDDLIMKGAQNPFTKTPYKDFRESEGKNRSKDIDALIIRNGGYMAYPYCFTGDVQILTENGFVDFAQLDKSAKVAQVSESGQITFVIPENHIEKDYDGEGYYLGPQRTKMICDSGHRFWGNFNNRINKEFNTLDAVSTILNIPFKYEYKSESKLKLNDDEIILLAAFISDGFLRKNNRIEVAVSKKRKINILETLDYVSKYTDSKCYGRNTPLTHYGFVLPESFDSLFEKYKVFKWDVLRSFSKEQADLFIKYYINFDGDGKNSVFTSSVELLDQLIFLGYVANKSCYSALASVSKFSGKPNYRVTYSDTKSLSIVPESIQKITLKEKLYCVSVPEQRIIVRYEMSSPIVVGNCMFGCQDILRAVEIKFNIKFDLPKTGSTQKFFNNTKPEYKTSTPDRLMIGIYQHGDEYKGHAIWCLGKQDKKQVATFEFNTSPDAGKEVIRDGQGCYFKTRNIEGYGDMRMRGFVDILKAIK